MAATAQDSSAPLRGASEKKEDTYEEDRKSFESDPFSSSFQPVEYSPFYGIEKGSVLQEARQFHQPQIDARKARQVRTKLNSSNFYSFFFQVITKLLYLVNQGESFTKVFAE